MYSSVKSKSAVSKKATLISFSINKYNHQSLLVVGLLFFTFILFSPALRNETLTGWDDGEYLTNPQVVDPQPGTGAAIFRDFHLGMYQPLAILSFLFNYKLSGEAPFGYIFVNLLLHLLNTWLVLIFIKRISGNLMIAGITAFLFAIHPMHVESVVWISVRSSLLYSAFFLAGLIQYHQYIATGAKYHYFRTLLWAILALFSKSMAVTFPLIMLVMDYLNKRSFTKKIVLEKLPFFALSIIFGIIAIKASSSFGHITTLETSYTFPERFALILYGISFYLVKAVVPLNISAIYAFPDDGYGNLPGWVYAPMVALLVVTLIILRARENRRLFIFGVLFFLFSLSVVLPLFWSRIFITADRYTYLSYIGVFVILATGITHIWQSRLSFHPSTRKIITFSAALIVTLLCISTIRRIRVWHDLPTLMNDVIDNHRSNSDLAHAYFYLGNFHDVKGDDIQAHKYYDLALSRNKNYLLALNNRGFLRARNGQLSAAINDFNSAISIQSNYAEAYYNRGVAYYQLNRRDEACNDWLKSSGLGFKQAENTRREYCVK